MQAAHLHRLSSVLALIAATAPGCGGPTEPQVEIDARIAPAATIYIMSGHGSPGFYAYETAFDTWSILPDPPVYTEARLTTDGQRVYMMGTDNAIYAYDPETQEWSYVQDGPGPQTGVAPMSFFQWTAQGFYHVQLNQNTLAHSSDGQSWNTLLLPRNGSAAGDYDPMRNRMYIKVANDMGIMVWDLVNNELADDFFLGRTMLEDSRAGSVLDGYFYTRNYAEPLLRIDVESGSASPMEINPSEQHVSTISDRKSGRIYFGPHAPTGEVFEVWIPELNMIRELAPLPEPITNHSTMALIR